MLKVAEVREACIEGHLVAQRDHAVVDLVDRIAVLQPTRVDRAPSGLAHRTVAFLEKTTHLRHGAGFAVEVNHHAADGLIVLLIDLRELGFERDVRLAEELDVHTQCAQQNLVARLR